MKILLDTSLLVRIAEPNAPLAQVSRLAVAQLPELELHGCLVPQVLYEFWSVATRPIEQNGLGLSTSEVHQTVTDYLAIFTLLRDERTVFEKWRQLVLDRDVKGKRVHDARIVAAMLKHGIRMILTLDPSDFQRYPEISVRGPTDLLQRPAPF